MDIAMFSLLQKYNMLKGKNNAASNGKKKKMNIIFLPAVHKVNPMLVSTRLSPLDMNLSLWLRRVGHFSGFTLTGISIGFSPKTMYL